MTNIGSFVRLAVLANLPDGSGVTGGGCAALITWVGPPHFYKRDQLIVVYAGSADDVLRPLEAVLGKPFVSR